MGQNVYFNKQPRFSDEVLVGYIQGDGVAWPTQNVTAIAAQYNGLTFNSTAGLFSTDYVQIPGSGTAGANDYYMVAQINSGTSADIFQGRPIVTGVAAVAADKYITVNTRFTPIKVELFNTTTGVRWEWSQGMMPNTAIKTAANGTVTVAADTGIITDTTGFHFNPALLGGASDKINFQVEYYKA